MAVIGRHAGPDRCLTPDYELRTIMAATDKTYRNQKTLDIVFAVSCILMLLSSFWMCGGLQPRIQGRSSATSATWNRSSTSGR